MKSLFLQIALACLMMALGTAVVVACSCGKNPSPCVSFQQSNTVFVGFVSSVQETEHELDVLGTKVKRKTQAFAHLLVEEPLKGVTEKELDVFVGHVCGYTFEQGKRYLVYAFREKHGGVIVSMCSRTRPLSAAPDDLEIIHAQLKQKGQARLFGVVEEFAEPVSKDGYQTDYVGPMAGLTVKIESLNGRHETLTDNDGRYFVENLKPGQYSVRLVVPPTHGMRYSFEKSTAVINVTPGSCWAAEVNFGLEVDGQVSGVIYDAEGQPAGKDVQVSIVAYDSARDGIAEVKRRSDWTDEQGRYKFDGLLPGRYVVGVAIADVPGDKTPYPPTYYPSARELSQASVITLTTGQKLTGINLNLPPPLEKITITGIVLQADGKPAAGVDVELYDRERPPRIVPDTEVETDARGRFSIQGFKGRRYSLKASKTETLMGVQAGLESESIELQPEAAPAPVTLILNKKVNVVLYP